MFFFLFCPQRRCHRKRKPNSRTWPNKTRFAMRGKWRITFPQRARRWSDLRTLTPPRGHRMFHNLPIVLVHFNSLFLKKCSIKNWHVFFFLFHRSAFFLFCADFRPKVKDENPRLSIGDTAKKLGEMWNSTSAEEKQPYERKAAKLKEKYDKVVIHLFFLL